MKRRAPITSAAFAAALLVASCGGSVNTGSVTSGPISFSTDPDSVVFEYVEVGGLALPEVAFQRPPLLLVTGDGLVILTPPPGLAIQGELLPDIWSQSLTGDGIETLLQAARSAGLFAERSYDAEMGITDQGTTTLRLSTSDETWTHEAYALGSDDAIRSTTAEVRAARVQLSGFVDGLGNLSGIVGSDALGPVEFYLPDSYLFVASPVPAQPDRPTLEWPTAATVRLADASTCQSLPEVEVGELFETAAANSLFTELGAVYEVLVKQAWPGATC